MKIDKRKLELVLAQRCETISSLRGKGLSPQTITRIANGVDVKPVTVGKLAKALGVDVREIIKED